MNYSLGKEADLMNGTDDSATSDVFIGGGESQLRHLDGSKLNVGVVLGAFLGGGIGRWVRCAQRDSVILLAFGGILFWGVHDSKVVGEDRVAGEGVLGGG